MFINLIPFEGTIMGQQSKEDKVLELFFNEGSKQWHFEEIVKKSKLSRDKANKWLTKFTKEKIIKKIKKKGKMPYYVSEFSNAEYKNSKRIYALNKLHATGFLNHLMSLKNAKTVILFGSFARADWYQDSDIDIFIYGNDDGFNKYEYEHKLKREIHVFTAENTTELKELGESLMQNIIQGNRIKGTLDFVEVRFNA